VIFVQGLLRKRRAHISQFMFAAAAVLQAVVCVLSEEREAVLIF